MTKTKHNNRYTCHTYSSYDKARAWAEKTNRELVPIGTCSLEYREKLWTKSSVSYDRVELVIQHREYMAEGERNEMYVVIKHYLVVVKDPNATDPKQYHYEETLEEALATFDRCVDELTALPTAPTDPK